MNDTNITGSGTASDPYIYNIHTPSQNTQSPWVLYTVVIAVCLAGAVGFLVGFHFGKRSQALAEAGKFRRE
jgi:hypothetical protein